MYSDEINNKISSLETQIDSLSKSVSNTVYTQSGNKSFTIASTQLLTVLITFPKAFANIPTVSAACVSNTSSISSAWLNVAKITEITKVSCKITIKATDWGYNNTLYPGTVNWTANAPVL